MTIAYEKYENMSRRQLINSLTSAEKKLDTLQEKFKIEQESQKNLIAFIKAKIKASLDDEASIPLKDSIIHKIYEQIEPQEHKELEAEIAKDMAEAAENDEL